MPVIPERGSWRPPPRSHLGAHTIKRAVSVCPHRCARTNCVHLAVILSKKEQEIYQFSVMSFILVESKDTLKIP